MVIKIYKSMLSLKIKVDQEYQDLRLDKFLATKFSDYSRSWLKHLIKKGSVLVNNTSRKPSYKLKANDELEILLEPPPEISLTPDSSIKFKIIYEDNDLIIIDKPASLVVHPGTSHKEKTLVNGLIAYCPAIKNVGQDPLRPGIVHRLDKDTSGLMLVAKNNSCFDYLKNLFKNRLIEKRYTALVFGHLKQKRGMIDFAISKSKRIPTKQVAIKSPRESLGKKIKRAVTYFKVLKYYPGYTLVEAIPKTGRMHQIRVHFASLGHRIVGDRTYRRRKEKFPRGISRHFLHASFLKFTLPDGEVKEFYSPLPKDLSCFLESLKVIKKIINI